MWEEVYDLTLYAPSLGETAPGPGPGDSLLFRAAYLCHSVTESDEPWTLTPRDLTGLLWDIAARAEDRGWRGNLWQMLLTEELVCSENPYSMACEGNRDPGGTLSRLALRDLSIFRRLFTWEFEELRDQPGGACLPELLDYDPGDRKETPDGALLRMVRDRLAAAGSDEEFAEIVSGFYWNVGVGAYALDRAFRLSDDGALRPLRGLKAVHLADLVGYEIQKRQLRENTEAFLAGRESNNVLLYGDAGTGKSTCVRALLTEYPDSGLRIVEVRKSQFRFLPDLIEHLRQRNYRFLLFIDDLSFEEHETEYKELKAVIEGGLSPLPDNLRIYATSNRRHIVREVWKDRNDMEHNGDVHRSDTVEEKLSLAGRFGVAINFSAPDRRLYHEMVLELARRQLAHPPEEESLLLGADAWEIRHGGVSGRTAQQYIDHLAGKANN